MNGKEPDVLSGSCGYKLPERSMHSKIVSRQTLLLVILTGFVFSLALFFDLLPQSLNLPASRQVESGSALLIENAVVPPEREEVSSGIPMRLKIPGIDVDAAVEYVGVTPDGAMDIPKSQDNAAWFELGQRPGENGSAVIAGHYGWRKNGKPSAFDNLYKLRKGDKLYIEDDKGAIITFVVRESRRYDPNADASDVFDSSDGKAHLNLVTCEGVWDEVAGSYSKRLVVFTDKVDSTPSENSGQTSSQQE